MTMPPPPDGTPKPTDPYAPVDYPANYPTPYPPYPAPSGYPPPSAYPPPTGYPYPNYAGYTADPYDPYRPTKPPGTNGKAIAALVTSLAGLLLCGLPSIAGIILGIIAMRETKRTGQDGFGLAVAGLAIGAVVVVGYVLWFVFWVLVAATVPSSPDYYP
ncbi:hypothetical protein FHT40_005487 [Mycolicibacterium sp. BK556]|uniref:DUF4190 domain-containing protein n=1 Tax=Mycobacteriaceae TaxID=1762 RepID=UPI0010EF6572|nr:MULTISPECIES: DUF4190 domain-containing protein [Mycobacteriaceae]MBB3605800.1 hypothetical protein [Mycolicibacterium sp. BK556]MBB3635703.1 hypothetical protein [Mycolicibacterium sp. BK607]MBB3753120.1 hypothetical protein [Mycolicibacterium sp. BK634]TDO09115.1 uncharacterized protein DUF4190 [Mycobacterium sp. BK086]